MQLEAAECSEIARGHGTLILSCQDEKREFVLKVVKNKIVQSKKNQPSSVQFSKFSGILDREFAIGSSCTHPNIVSYLSLHPQAKLMGGNYYALEMEHLHGDAHKHYVENQQGGGSSVLKSVFQQISQAIQHLHDKGISHNDLKPENIFFSKEGVPKIGDFGCARNIQYLNSMDLLRQEWQQRQLQYAAPEIFDFLEAGEIDEKKTDIFALGQTFFVIAYGVFPKRFLKPTEKCEIYRHVCNQDLAGFREATKQDESQNLFLDLVMKMMNPDVGQRLEIQQVLDHQFFQVRE